MTQGQTLPADPVPNDLTPVDGFCLRVTNQSTAVEQQKYNCLKSHKAASPEM